MSMKLSLELSVSPSVSLLGRVILVGSVLGFATACSHRDAAKTDTTVVASADSATSSTSTVAATQPATPVESVSTGETTISAESKSNPSVAATNVTTGAAKVTAKPAAPAMSHKVHTAAAPKAAAPPMAKPVAATAPPMATAAASDTGQKTATADTTKQAAATDTAKAAAGASGADHLAVSPQEYEGWKMFAVYCYRCHGVDAMGGGIAPNLRHSVSSEGNVTHDVFVTTVTYGRTALGMPTWRALLSPEQIEDLWLYVNARSSGRLYPGRPHMASGANP
ncbi:MAG: cytochrome c [Gemmatimonadaceae bacterium]